MNCPKCGGKVVVTDNAHNTDTNEIYRKKKCLVCNHRFTTIEFEVEQDKKFKSEFNKFRYGYRDK